MLVNFNEILKEAKEKHYAVPHFNINNLEWTKYILEECNKLQVPVILGVSSSAAQYMGGWSVPIAFTKSLIEELNINIPVCLHVDHGSFDDCKEAIDAGFKSVMIDASKYSFTENIDITKSVVSYAHKYNVSVEAELGYIGSNISDESNCPSKETCLEFYKETGIDALAPAIGNAHGIYKQKPHLQLKHLGEISKIVPIPLVLHGGSGISDEDIKECIKNGISKININTDLQIAWAKGIRKFLQDNKDVYDPRKIILSGRENMINQIKHLVKTFNTKRVSDFSRNNTI